MRHSRGKVGSLEGSEVFGYGLTSGGRPYALFQGGDERGLRTSRLIKLEPLPEGTPLESTRIYVMGAAAGFAAARYQRLQESAPPCTSSVPSVLLPCPILPGGLSLPLILFSGGGKTDLPPELVSKARRVRP